MRGLAVAAVLALALAVASASPADAWGREGHAAIADMAEALLTPTAERQARALLALEGAASLAAVASWADDIRPARPETASWHFVDIPIRPPGDTVAGYDARRDCPAGDCIVAKIDAFAAILHDRARPAAERLEALKFVVHLVGDLSQPLHCSDDNDRGGNAVRLTFEGRPTNLHSVWDNDLVRIALGDRAAAAAPSPDLIAAWQHGTTADWATDSYRVAVTDIYGRFTAPPTTFSREDEIIALPIVLRQIEKGGVRLAKVLNDALD